MRKLLNSLASSNLKWYFIGILGYFLFAAAFLFAFIMPQFDKYDNLIAEQIDLEGTYVNLVDLNIDSAIDSVKAQIESLEVVQREFEDRLLTDRNFNSLMPIIDSYCTKSNLTVAKLDPVKDVEKVKPKYLKRSINAALVGKYHNFITFLGKLEANPEWLLIDELRIQPTREATIYRFSFVISILMEDPKNG